MSHGVSCTWCALWRERFFMSPLALLLCRGEAWKPFRKHNPSRNVTEAGGAELNVCTLSPEIAVGHLIFLNLFFFLYIGNVCADSFSPTIPTALSVAMVERDTKPNLFGARIVWFISHFSPHGQTSTFRRNKPWFWCGSWQTPVFCSLLFPGLQNQFLWRGTTADHHPQNFLVVRPERTPMDAQTPAWRDPI